MSRQKGRRKRPAPERRAFVDRYSKADRRRERRDQARSRREERRVTGVRWSAVMAGTLVSIVAYGLVANAVVEAADGDVAVARWSAAGAAALVPFLMLLLAFLTRVDTPWQTAAFTAAGAVLVFLVATFAVRDIATAYVLGAGGGAAFAMRLDPSIHDRRWRLWTIVGLAVYTKAVYLISPGIAVVAAPLLPVFGIAIIDSVTERRAEA